MSLPRNTPGAVILDLLRSSPGRERSTRSLVQAGKLFGFSGNAMRVNLSRLAARGRIESPARGRWRLTRSTDALNDFVERWRLGEARVRPWEPGTWLLAHRPEDTAPDPRDAWILDALGFRAVRPGLLARPDNLAEPLPDVRALARGLGLGETVLIVAARLDEDPAPRGWVARWAPAALETAYADGRRRLDESARRLPGLAPDRARLECFALGGTMINRLAKDPLLPSELVDAGARRALWRAMVEYDAQGRHYWGLGENEGLRRMPRPALTTTA